MSELPVAGSLRLRVKVWIDKGGVYVLGEGLAHSLEAVRRARSLVAAARRLGQSYRYLWGRLRAAERAWGKKLVVSELGGTGAKRSRLTPFGELMVKAYFEFHGGLERDCAARFRRLARELRSAAEPQPKNE
ncbi:MAG: LysR family transcriptional regulator [Planctomycetota bacterium]|nr:LysR family transcriptional regulator [Planctomycetota bacterium]